MTSRKNKKLIRRPESEQITVENTYPALVSQKLWDIAQNVRQNKKRIPKQMGEPNIFSGLVFCISVEQLQTLSSGYTEERNNWGK